MRSAILDTDTISLFFRGNPNVVPKVDKYLKENGQVYISVISYYEVLYGLYYKDARNQMQRFINFVNLNRIAYLTKQSSGISARIAAELRSTGKGIGHNDILIAGIAIENDFVLITNNTKHFNRIGDLSMDNWTVS